LISNGRQQLIERTDDKASEAVSTITVASIDTSIYCRQYRSNKQASRYVVTAGESPLNQPASQHAACSMQPACYKTRLIFGGEMENAF